ncbi:hypothetical protein [Actinacidiphila acidipaludis]|uniref:Uncharacterized protein n=1 Tax=Actinacidiphila acidipaludis TaxID=2873382 RepID=A0ABS7Q3B0_9ACTN|nr:hypothetical protein [Streptomyces acidipaludis]MBY8877641.1 hypothetical protein [Streptomyces acidipaludis]
MKAQTIRSRRGTQPRLTLPPWQLLARSPVFAAVGAYVGMCLTARAWSDCPLGNDAAGETYLVIGTTPLVWFAMTAALLLCQLSLWGATLPLPGLRCLQWVLPVAVAVLLTVLYRAGMHSPVVQPDGTCMEGYPHFPFEPKQNPGPHG